MVNVGDILEFFLRTGESAEFGPSSEEYRINPVAMLLLGRAVGRHIRSQHPDQIQGTLEYLVRRANDLNSQNENYDIQKVLWPSPIDNPVAYAFLTSFFVAMDVRVAPYPVMVWDEEEDDYVQRDSADYFERQIFLPRWEDSDGKSQQLVRSAIRDLGATHDEETLSLHLLTAPGNDEIAAPYRIAAVEALGDVCLYHARNDAPISLTLFCPERAMPALRWYICTDFPRSAACEFPQQAPVRPGVLEAEEFPTMISGAAFHAVFRVCETSQNLMAATGPRHDVCGFYEDLIQEPWALELRREFLRTDDTGPDSPPAVSD